MFKKLNELFWEVLFLPIVATIIFSIVLLSVSNFKEKSSYTKVRDTMFGKYHVVCLEGHTYYSGDRTLALKLTDDGRPIKCSIKKKK